MTIDDIFKARSHSDMRAPSSRHYLIEIAARRRANQFGHDDCEYLRAKCARNSALLR
ncbi:hypothetical protein ML401_38715 [Bradyrhizobium sp. 62B]|nr:hypothetical protein ML401_38715 [Bradyrhizobium sp. 62B]